VRADSVVARHHASFILGARTTTTAGTDSGTGTGTDSGTGHESAGGNSNSVLNISGNQLPIQACNDVVPVNGIGGDVPLSGIAAALSVTIAAAISLWLRDVLAVTSLDVTADEGQLIVTIGYTVLATSSPASLTLSVPGGP